MNQGKRLIRNTVFALAGMTVLMVGAARLLAATDLNTPQWLRSAMSLGLKVSRNSDPAVAPQLVSLADVREFTQLSVEGDVAVEVVEAASYKVSLASPSGAAWNIGAEWHEGGPLRLKVGEDIEGAVLRVEAPKLTLIEAEGLRSLTLRGWKAKDLTLRMKNIAAVRIEDSAVVNWNLNAETPLVMQVDQATISGGLTIRPKGQITINGPAGRIMNFRGSGGSVAFKPTNRL